MANQQSTYAITNELRAIRDQFERSLQESEGEITETIEQIEQELLQATEKAADKLQRIHWVYNEMSESQAMIEGLENQLKERLKAVQARRKALGNGKDRLKDLVLQLMKASELKTIELGDRVVKVRQSTALEILDLETALKVLPPDCIRIKKEVDKTAVKALIKSSNANFDGLALTKRDYVQGL